MDYCSLYHTDTKDHFSFKIIMELNQAKRRFITRITGGAASVDIDKGLTSMSLFRKALRGYDGMMLIGGTRVLSVNRDSANILPTIMEIAPLLKHDNPNMMTFGIVPRPEYFKLCKWGMIVSEEPNLGCITIVNPEQDICLTVQKDVDTPAVYDVEWQSCLHVVRTYKETGRRRPFGCVLIAYEGGSYTRKEVLAWTEQQLPVILIENSGRATDILCHELRDHPSVSICSSSDDIRKKMIELGGLDADN